MVLTLASIYGHKELSFRSVFNGKRPGFDSWLRSTSFSLFIISKSTLSSKGIANKGQSFKKKFAYIFCFQVIFFLFGLKFPQDYNYEEIWISVEGKSLKHQKVLIHIALNIILGHCFKHYVRTLLSRYYFPECNLSMH